MNRAALLVAIAGCNQVFGLEETVPAQDRGSVTGVYRLRWAENDDSGAPVVRDGVFGVDEVSADVELDDGTRRDVTLGSDGTFSFPTARTGQAYSLTFRSTYSRRTYQLSAPHLVLVDRIGARRDRALVPPNTELVYQVANRPLSTLTSREEIMTTGIWTRRQVSGPTIRYDWASATTQSEPLGLLDGAKHDDAYYVFIDRAAAYNRITAAARTRGTLAGGASTVLSATAAPVDATECTRIAIQTRQERERLFALYSDATSSLSVWLIHAIPAHELAYSARLPLAFPIASVDDQDVAQDVSYGSPFVGGTRELEHGIIIYRPTTGYASLTMVTPVQADCATPTTIAAGVVAVPTAIEVAASELAAMDQFVMIDRSARVPVTWRVSDTGAFDDAVVTLFEIVDTIGVVRQTVYTTADRVLLDPADLETGRRYIVNVQLRLGNPGAAAGDYEPTDDDKGVGQLQSAPFTIAN